MEEVDRHFTTENEENINMNLLKEVSEKIEQYLGEYVEKDSSLFMTKLK